VLTIATIPKPFRGHIGVIQRNAIQSWTLLRPKPQILLFADEQGTSEIARDLNLSYFPNVTRNEFGTPLLSDVMALLADHATNDLLCYINADILLTVDFTRAVAAIHQKLARFLIVSSRINVDLSEPINFDADWETDLRRNVLPRGVLASHTYIDVFVFPKGIYTKVPHFAIGRPWFDHWFIRTARKARLPIVDLTPSSPIIHQNHDYGHVMGGVDGIWRSRETEQNLKLYGKVLHDYTLADATHELLPDGQIVKRISPKRPHSLRYWFWEVFIQNTLSLRQRFGLRRQSFRGLAARWRR